MYNYRIVEESGRVVIVRAISRKTAVMLYCESEGCSREYVKAHCVVRRVGS